MNRAEILAALNPEQAEAAGRHEGPVLVLAGAGTGKTRVITYRIACMLADGIPGSSILGLTFTNKAAGEMRTRLEQLVGPAAAAVTLGTFHSFCIRLLRQYAVKLGFASGFSVADESDQQGIFKQACGDCGFGKETIAVGAAFARISDWKNHLVTPEEALRQAETSFEVQTAHIYERCRDLMEMQNLIDFDDMLLLVWRLFNEVPEVLAKCRERYHYLLVDEYQDTNTAQFEIVKLLAGPKPNLCVVGDDDQSIYSWRGAEVQNILNFPDIFPGTLVVKLEQNYRSTSAILAAANAVINTGANRHPKKLWSNLGEGTPPVITRLDMDSDEASFAADLILSRRSERPELNFRDFAVLYRSNQLSRQVEQALLAAGIPYRVVGGQKFFQRREVKDAVAYLKLLVNPRDDQSVLRLLAAPPRGVGPKAVTALKEGRVTCHRPMTETWKRADFLAGLTKAGAAGMEELFRAMEAALADFAEPGDLAVKCRKYLLAAGYIDGLQKIYRDREDTEKRRDNVDEFISAIAQYERKNPGCTLEDYLESYALLEENDTEEKHGDGDDAVTLSSIHAAKGLEFPVVIQIAMERNIFPHERALREKSEDEELRLFYVAITRAREELYLTHAGHRLIRGAYQPSAASPFLKLLDNSVAVRREPEELVAEASADESKAAIENILKMLEPYK